MGKETYSVYEAKAKFSELLRKVRRNKRIVITSHGTRVAEIIPIGDEEEDLETYLDNLQEEGQTSTGQGSLAEIAPLVFRPGALARFLDDRQD